MKIVEDDKGDSRLDLPIWLRALFFGLAYFACAAVGDWITLKPHNGRIWVESTLGKGSRFFVALDTSPVKSSAREVNV